MASPSVTYTFANSTTADATQVNQNFSDIINSLTDGSKDVSINALTCAGTATFNGNTNIGNATADDLTITASLASTLNVKTTYSYDIGSTTIGLKNIALGSTDSAAKTVKLSAPVIATSYTFTFPTSQGTSGQVLMSAGAAATPTWRAITVPSVQKFLAAPTGATSYTFTITSGNATLGATYTNNGQTFTVIATVASSTTVQMTGTGTPATSGTLTKSTGTGDATLTFSSFGGVYTTAAGVTWIRVRLIGGGAGGAGGGSAGNTTGGAGGLSSFGTALLVANGGGAPSLSGSGTAGVGGTASLGSGPVGIAISGGGGGAGGVTAASATIISGGNGGVSFFGGAGSGGDNAGNGTAGATNSGSGGGGGGTNATGSNAGPGGGAGGYVDAIITAPSATYSYFVGAAGTAGGAGTSGGAGAAGGSGQVVVEEYYQ